MPPSPDRADGGSSFDAADRLPVVDLVRLASGLAVLVRAAGKQALVARPPDAPAGRAAC